MGVNQFTALTKEEFAAKYLTQFEPHSAEIVVEEESKVGGPVVDWISYGAVSPVKDQGTCTASYAFSAIGAIEGISVIFSKITSEYSLQQMIDCTTGYGNQGCSTGNMVNCFNYIRQSGK